MNRSDYRQWFPKLTPIACPFCGKKPAVLPKIPEAEGDAWGMVACVRKRCPVKPRCRDRSTIADLRGPGAYKDMAIRLWNKRSAV